MSDFKLGPRRAVYIDIEEDLASGAVSTPLGEREAGILENFDRIYRSLCAILYNYVPTSGHPGGSISSGRIVSSLLFGAMDYDLENPHRDDADLISYAAGHKALGLYAMWALRDEIALAAAPELLPADNADRLRLEDLLGFRRNPSAATPLVTRLESKALDGHPTPATPFVRLATGASGVGLASSLGLALGARDWFGDGAPKVHIIEGEGGLTPGRASESLAAAATASLDNVILHVDWNQSSIDSDRVCRDGDNPGDYVQWTPVELAYVNDWNVIYVPAGHDFQQIIAAQRRAASIDNGQPIAIVYRTVKGWQYGIEGKASHGAGHHLCSAGFFASLLPLTDLVEVALPICETKETRCNFGADAEVLESCFWEALTVVRRAVSEGDDIADTLADRLRQARERLEQRERKPRAEAPRLDALHEIVATTPATPKELALEAGTKATLRGELGRTLDFLNRQSGGAVLGGAADLLGSTSAATLNAGFDPGFFNAKSNPGSRLLSIGGICEDALSGVISGLSTFGRHLGVGSSYAAFIAPLGHIAARLHAIGNQAARAAFGEPFRPLVLICAHAGLKTGEDGPTHADPQPLQLLQGDFPSGTTITLTPWDPQEVWPLMSAALRHRPAVIAPFVTRPKEPVLDRARLGLAPPEAAVKGVYVLRAAQGTPDAVVVLQGSGVTYAFLQEALPILDREDVDLQVYYVASAELFDLLETEEREAIFPADLAGQAMGISGFTLPTLYRWVTSARGREASLYPFRKGHYLGSGAAPSVLAEAGLDGASQAEAILSYVESRKDSGAGANPVSVKV